MEKIPERKAEMARKKAYKASKMSDIEPTREGGDRVGPNKRSSLSLQSQLVLLLLSLLAPILFLQAALYHERLEGRRALVIQSNLEVARALAKTFDGFIQDVLSQELTMGMALTSSQPLPEADVNRILMGSKARYPAVRDFNFFDPQGRCLSSTNPALVGMDVSDREFFQEIAGGKAWAVGNLMLSRIGGEPIFSVSHGIRNEEGRLLGVASAAVSPERLNEELAIERKDEGRIGIFDKEGRLVYQYPGPALSWEQRSRTQDYENLQDALRGKEVSCIVSSIVDGTNRMVSQTPIVSIGWVAGAGVSESKALAPVFAPIKLHAFIFVLTTFVVFFIALLFSRKIFRPVKKLQEQVHQLGCGKLDHRIETGGAAELQNLARSFDIMAQKIRSREQDLLRVQDGLELSVRERTAELEKTNEVLKGEIAEHNRAREIIGLERKRLNSLLNNLPAFVFLMAGNYSIPFANRYYEERFGSPENRRCYTVHEQLSAPCAQCLSIDVLRTGKAREWEWTHLKSNRTYQVFGYPFTDTDGSPLVLVLGIDITDRKRAEEEIEALNADLSTIFNSVPATIWYKDTQNNFIRVNKAASDMVGARAEDIEGRSARELFPIDAAKYYADDLEVIRSGRPRFRIVETVRNYAGEIRWVETDKLPIKDASGNVTGVLVFAMDVTERQLAGQALRESEEKYRSLAETSTDYIMRYDKEGRHLYVNSACAAFAGISAEAFIGKTHRELGFDPDKSRVWEEKIREVFETATPRQWEFEFESTRGRSYLDWRLVPEFKDGKVETVLGVSRDITERVLAEEAVRQSEKELRALSSRLLSAQEEERRKIAADIHDSLSSSLSAVKIALENARSGLADQGTPADALDVPISWTQYAIDETRRMMTDLRPSILDDLGLVATISWFLRQYRSTHSNIFIEEEIGLEESVIPGDLRIVIFRIIQEAFNNSAKYSNAEYMGLSLLHADKRLDLLIEDNGDGFDLDEAFSKRDSGRGGLGLTSMKERAELSGGSFSIQSVIGAGTTLRASWPV